MTRIHRPSSSLLVLALAAAVLASSPARGSVPLTLDFNDGFTFSGVSRNMQLSGLAQLPLGDGFGLVSTQITLSAIPGTRFDTRAVFPGQGGQTVSVNDGDQILFEVIADIILSVTATDVDPVANFGGGLGTMISRTAQAQLQGSGTGIANTMLPNLGLLSDPLSLSLLLGNLGGSLAQLPLGVDLDGNGVMETLNLDNLVNAGFGAGALDFRYGSNGTVLLDHIPGTGGTFNGSGSINPNFGFQLDIGGWTIEQDLLVAPVPEPDSFPLIATGLLGLGWLRKSRRWSVANTGCFSSHLPSS